MGVRQKKTITVSGFELSETVYSGLSSIIVDKDLIKGSMARAEVHYHRWNIPRQPILDRLA